jgi:hypothetical protein
VNVETEDKPTLVSDRDLLADPVIAALLAHVPGVVVQVDHALGDNAVAYRDAGGARTRRIALGAEAAFGPADVLYGTVAHEVAHHVLGHVDATPMQRLAYAGRAALGVMPFLAYFLAGRELWLACAALAVAYGLLTALEGWILRRVELAADARSVHLLNATGLDGRMVVRAFLAPETWWKRVASTLWGSHPSTAARLRVIARQQ